MMDTTFSTNLGGGAPASDSIMSAMGGTPGDMFTKLLVAQIRNQNPLEPSDPGEFVNQLSQLSQMEALQKLAAQTVVNASMLESLQTLALGAQVGSEVTVRTNQLQLSDQPVHGSFHLENASAQVTLIVTAADGREQRIELGTQAPGAVRFSFDPAHFGLQPGKYGIRVETSSKESVAVDVTGRLNGVKLSQQGVMLDVATVGEVSSVSITQFNGPKTI